MTTAMDVDASIVVSDAVRRARNAIAAANNVTDVVAALRDLTYFLPSTDIDGPLQKEFRLHHHGRLLTFLLRNVVVAWLACFSSIDRSLLFDIFFSSGEPCIVFMGLVSHLSISMSSHSALAMEIANQLGIFVSSGRLHDVLISGEKMESEERQLLVTLLVSLPDRMANVEHAITHKSSHDDLYTTSSAKSLIFTDSTLNAFPAELAKEVFSLIDNNNGIEEDDIISFLGEIVGRLSIAGHSRTMAKAWLLSIPALTSDWERRSTLLLTHISDGHSEALLVALLHRISRYCVWGDSQHRCKETTRSSGSRVSELLCSRVIAPAIIACPRLSYIMIDKFLLVRVFPVAVLRVIIYILENSSTDGKLLRYTFSKLCDAWGDPAVISTVSAVQQCYLSQGMLLILAVLRRHSGGRYNSIPERESLLLPCLRGVTSRLGNASPQLQRLGMVVGECVARELAPDATSLECHETNEVEDDLRVDDAAAGPLKFDYKRDGETELLLRIYEQGGDFPFFKENEQFEHMDIIANVDTADRPRRQKIADLDPSAPIDLLVIESEEDSGEEDTVSDGECDAVGHSSSSSDDDDLPFYETSKSNVPRRRNNGAVPVYIRECIASLRSTDDRTRFDTALKACPSLIRQNPPELREVALDATRVLLNLNDTFGLPDFAELRLSALQALAISAYETVALYLSSQIYEKGYAISTRTLILDVLVSVARELCALEKPAALSQHPETSTLVPHSRDNISYNKREAALTIANRVNAKTRYFAAFDARKRANARACGANRFAAVAGIAFFPLLARFDGTNGELNLLTYDVHMLIKLLHTLGIMVECAGVSSPALLAMSRALLDFATALRFHENISVVRGVLFAIAIVVRTVPPFMLFNGGMAVIVGELQAWANDIWESHLDPKCRELAGVTLTLCAQKANELRN